MRNWKLLFYGVWKPETPIMYITITLRLSALIYQTLTNSRAKFELIFIINVILNDVNVKCPGNVLLNAETYFVNIEQNEL